MKTRVKTGALLVAAVVLVLLLSHISWVMCIAAAFLSVFAVHELYSAANLRDQRVLMAVSFLIALVMSFVTVPGYEAVLAVLLPIAMVLFGLLMSKIGKLHQLKPWQVLLTAAVCAAFFASIRYIRLRQFGLYELTMGILVCMVTDSCAYLVGCRFGRHKLAPKVSPSKTMEGAVGGTVGAVAVMLLLNGIIHAAGGPAVHYGKMTAYLVISSLVGQYGDLCMSAYKRIVGIKDYSHLLPGHGGILDRFDSQLFALPFTYLFCAFFGSLYYKWAPLKTPLLRFERIFCPNFALRKSRNTQSIPEFSQLNLVPNLSPKSSKKSF